MTDYRRYQELSDDQLAEVIRQLPRRRPGSHLRDRVLFQSAAQALRPSVLLRPALAAAAIGILLVLDIAALRLQDRGLAVTGSRAAATVAARTEDRADDAWLHQMRASRFSFTVARLRADERASSCTYRELLNDLLREGQGGRS
jgi:hypothetical protein